MSEDGFSEKETNLPPLRHRSEDSSGMGAALLFIGILATVVLTYAGVGKFIKEHKKLTEPSYRVERVYKESVPERSMPLKKFADSYNVPVESLVVWNNLPEGYTRVGKKDTLRTSYVLDSIRVEPNIK